MDLYLNQFLLFILWHILERMVMNHVAADCTFEMDKVIYFTGISHISQGAYCVK